MAEPQLFDPPFKLLGGWLCLDFVNTANWDSPADAYERFHSYDDLVRWNRYVGLLTDDEAGQIHQEAVRQPAQTAAFFEYAMQLRAVIHRFFSAMAVNQAPRASDLATLNTVLAETLAQSRLVPAEGGFAWAWAGADRALERVFWPVAWSIAELLTSDKLDRVRRCAGPSCGWLFLDTSRNRSRRWCDMKHCGNQAKARRHYRRKTRTTQGYLQITSQATRSTNR